jgi:(p)ppGpp synthase/HD superfamily hydrolase
LKTISFDKLLEAHRKWEKTNSYNAIVELKIFNKYWNLLKIISILSDLHIPINKIEMINNWDLTSSINFESEFENPAKFFFLLNSLKKYDNSIQVTKKTIN